jgi:hypothetical protein
MVKKEREAPPVQSAGVENKLKMAAFFGFCFLTWGNVCDHAV